MNALALRSVCGFALLLAASAGCRRGAQDPSRGGASSGGDGSATAPAEDPCAPARLGLPNAHPVTRWTVPAGCQPNGTPTEPQAIRSEADFAARFTCPAGASAGVDFAAQTLWVTFRSLSPAGAGTRIVDDGSTLTFIEVFRANCPDDPRPMPMPPSPYAYLLPATATRTTAQTTCTLPRSCP